MESKTEYCAVNVDPDLGHPGSEHSPDQLAHQVECHRRQLDASAQVDGNGEGRVKVGAARGRGRAEISKRTQTI